ncbi:MAG: hypothetical protein GY839_09460 [candidate division Zixibacteria bacterium]|nr:hypothetical protein [candidate division Zixibacteria bacterium]
MENPDIGAVLWYTLAAFLTLSIFSFLYKDNPFYRLAEHLIVGISAGYWIAILYHTSLNDLWLEPIAVNFSAMFAPGGSALGEFGMALTSIVPGLLGLMMFSRFFSKISWLSRWPIAFYLAITAGVALPLYLQSFTVRQMQACMIGLGGSPWEIIADLIIVLGTISGLAYFYFSMEHKGMIGGMAKFGIWILMLGFGSTFGYTVMSRISLLIGRFNFLIEWYNIVAGYLKA